MAKKTAAKRPKSPTASPVKSSLRAHCRSLPAVTEDIKWGDDLIFSVGGKMFAGFGADDLADSEFSFKCDDHDFMRLTQIKGIIPAPYAARFGWVAVRDRKAQTDAQWRSLLTKAHTLIAAKLSSRKRRQLGLDEPPSPRG